MRNATRSSKSPLAPRPRASGFGLRGLPVVIALAYVPLALPAYGGDRTFGGARELAELSLEELMNETVTSVSKREQKRIDAATAISVLSSEDIRRSGSHSIPDALRVVPGVNVAAVNARDVALSIRGFNSVFANKLLVLIDGRSIYVPTISGVYWNLQQPMLEDLDRIEVIRGPGATIWGANAVNGVINIVSRSARETQGGMVYGGVGGIEEFVGMRHGSRIGENTYYRVFGSYRSHDDHPFSDGTPDRTGWETRHAGYRFDHYAGGDTHATWQGDYTEAADEYGVSEAYNVNTLGRWTRDIDGDTSWEIQAYYDRTHREDQTSLANTVDTLDITLENKFVVADAQEIIWGVGYRLIGNRLGRTNPAALILDEDFSQQTFSAFAQNEWTAIRDVLTLTAGLKIEHNDMTGMEFQPSVRGTFKPTENQTVWAAISRAVRIPSQLEGLEMISFALEGNLPGTRHQAIPLYSVGDDSVVSEVLWAYELGYRLQWGRRVSFDLAMFFHDYSDMPSISDTGELVLDGPFPRIEIPWTNKLSAWNYGAELAVTFLATDSLRFTGSYSFLESDVRAEDGGGPLITELYEKSAPRHQAALRASYAAGRKFELNGQLRYVGSNTRIPSFVTADLRLAYHANEHVELSLVGRNLLDDRHPERGYEPATIVSEVPRSIYCKILLRF